ncbi:DUF3783 domain-containing protein [Clostridium rectalis]|uniref:DUF3783 domain-containing protein n=1 Tax=Clostridium rectalis TaxID=2040295 RepID=UPI000F63AE2F|nr:DUF3783 domain-containing protein [Clostridium rectalis]
MENDKVILIYGFNGDEKKILQNLIKQNNLPNYLTIENDMVNMKVKDILNRIKLPILNTDVINEKVILFNNLPDKELDKAITLIKMFIKPMPILAVVTDISIEWIFKDLLKHLIEEREWFRNQGK